MKSPNTPSIIKILWFTAKKYYHEPRFRKQIVALFFLEFLSNLYPLLISYMLAKVVDKSIYIINTKGTLIEMVPLIVALGVIVLLWIIVSNVYQYLNAVTNMWVSYLDDEVYLRRYLEIEPQAYENSEFVNDKSALKWNANVVYNSLYTGMSSAALIPVVLISFGAIFKVTPLLALCAIVASIPTAIIVKKFGRRVWGIWNDRGEEKVKYSIYKNSIWTTNFESYQEIFVFKYGGYLLDKAKEINKRFCEKLQDNHKRRYFWTSVASILSSTIFIFAIIYSINLALKGNISVGILTFIISSYQKFNSDISDLFYDISWIGGNKGILEKFYSIQNWKNKIINGKRNLPNNTDGIAIEFRNVWFKYPETDKWILKGVNFTARSDEDIAIVGKNGVGKSTLIKLILRVYDPDKGEIWINGINIKELNLDNYYKNIGILSQSFNRLGVTAEDNIHVGDVEKPKNRELIEKAAKKADVHDALLDLPSGYTTFLSREVKGGIQLSGGQWQKLAIARAFFRDAKLLILDEPTSAVDALAEETIFDNIRENAKNKTTLIVSHRFATVRRAKRIIVIDSGKIVEDGNHEELMNHKGLYSTMYNAQNGDK